MAGLDFIKRLRPVHYQWKEGQGDKVFTCFIAQEVEEAAKAVDFDFSAVKKPVRSDDYYSLSYAEFVVPLVKAIQELYEQNRQLQNKLEALTTHLSKENSLIQATTASK